MDPLPPTRYRLLVAYEGGAFLGWQSQASGNTVQDHLEAAFLKLCGTRIAVHGSGRTDTGVHAFGQVAHVDIRRSPIEDWPAALNAHLPQGIRVMECAPAPSKFHARFCALGKTYIYRIWNAPVQNPFEVGRSWHLPGDLDFPMLSQCAALLVGTHDFGGFAANRGKPGEDTVRTITGITATQKGPLITLTFEGSGFLYKMVRLLAGSLVRCAQHRAEPQWLQDILERKKKSSFAAPAHGLYLRDVRYPPDSELEPNHAVPREMES